MRLEALGDFWTVASSTGYITFPPRILSYSEELLSDQWLRDVDVAETCWQLLSAYTSPFYRQNECVLDRHCVLLTSGCDSCVGPAEPHQIAGQPSDVCRWGKLRMCRCCCCSGWESSAGRSELRAPGYICGATTWTVKKVSVALSRGKRAADSIEIKIHCRVMLKTHFNVCLPKMIFKPRELILFPLDNPGKALNLLASILENWILY